MLRTNLPLLNFIEEYSQQHSGVETRTYTAGQTFIQQGSEITTVQFLVSGITKCYILEENGKDYIFEFLGKGEVVGDIEAIRQEKCLCNITAITEVQTLVIHRSLFNSLLQNYPAFNAMIMQELATRISQTCTRSAYQQLYPVEYALLRVLTLENEQQIFLSKKDLAAYLGITLRSFNRTVKQLRQEKILDAEELQLGISRQALLKILNQFDE
ncbi:Crp/Fnr family transcriptional regulator [Chitinophaga silvatica]|nr:Crp/Fnr family transcriptional regulator [Chitinophaga silvatica]